jgi:hypothetical protein
VQISTDAAQGIIVGVGLSQSAGEWGQLNAAMDRIQKKLGRLPEQVVVDGGFTSREAILDMDDRGVDFIGAIADTTIQAASQFARRGIEVAFRPEAFTYHPESDTFTCPAGKVLDYERKHREIGLVHYYYRASATDCGNCEYKKNCCPANTNAGRMVLRAEEAPAVAAFRAKMATAEAKQIYRQRGAVAEFPNAWIKTKIGLRQFRLRGFAKVRMETLWACLTYNIQQWIRLCWRKPLALRTV